MRTHRADWFIVLSALLAAGCSISSSPGTEPVATSPGTEPVATAGVALQAAASPQTSAAGSDTSKKPDAIRFAVIGDDGDATGEQYDVGIQMEKSRQAFPFDFVLMLGDNLYGGNSPSDYKKKFEQPYKALLDGGVKFYASLGNHDNSNERFYEPFNMGGQRFYTFTKGNVAFFALDSNYMNPEQMAWLDQRLKASDAAWKICYFHHPLYSDGKTHGSDPDLRARIEPIFIKNGVNLVLSGHDHVYERIQPQHGIYYFVEGNSGELRPHDLRASAQTIKGFDTDRAFLLMEIAGDELRFQAITRSGQVVDSGTLANHDSTRPPS